MLEDDGVREPKPGSFWCGAVQGGLRWSFGPGPDPRASATRPSTPGLRVLAIYLFLLVVGAGLAGLSLAGDVLGGATDLDLDFELDADGGLELDGASIWKAFSLLGLVYGAMGAGATGTILNLLWGGEQVVLTATLSAGTGLAAGGLATVLLTYLKRSGSGDLPAESSFEGLPAWVTLPLREGVPGRIRVRRGSRKHVLRALPYGSPPRDGGPPESWTHVVVVEVRRGVAYVAPVGPELERLKP
jgi:hypothetical protein